MYFTLHSSTCFEYQHAHLQEDKLYILYIIQILYTTTGHYKICCKNLSLALLKMGKRLPETCWADLADQKIVIVASSWFFCITLPTFTNFNAQFLYSITIYMLHYNPRHVSSINIAHLQEDKLYYHSIWYRHCSVQYSTVYRMRAYQIPDAVIIQFVLLKMGNVNARNMSRIVM
jgi:hypothetical protein